MATRRPPAPRSRRAAVRKAAGPTRSGETLPAGGFRALAAGCHPHSGLNRRGDPRRSPGILVTLALLLSAGTASAAGKFPKPMSYARPVGTAFVFVQIGDPAEEAKHGTAEQQRKFAELRAKYPAPGVYRAGDAAELVWATPAGEYVPYDLGFVTADGKNLVRVEGDFWQTESFVGGVRPTAAKQQALLDAPALSFFAEGKLTKRYLLSEFIDDTEVLKHTPEHLIWYASAVLNDDAGKFVLFTQSPARFTFDARSGELIERGGVGLANPILKTILVVCGVFTALILLAWGLFVWKRRVPDSVRLARQS